MKKKAYLTTALPYVNAAPHIGFALELAQADAIARFLRLQGKEVFFNTGTDEHGTKIYENARAEGTDVREYVTENAAHFKRLCEALNVDTQDFHFIRTTDEAHMAAAQEFWKRCDAAGDIYKAKYAVKYCTGCELEKTESELENGKCLIHPNLTIEEREEENYFFRFSKYQKQLLELYERYPDFVIPTHRQTEIRNFVVEGAKDFSVSRLKEKMPWGVPVPGDEKQVMYVWFDALVNYVSTLGWPTSAEATAGKPPSFSEWWGTKDEPKAIQFAGKDNLRQQAAMWQAMLMSAGLPPSRRIVIHGFITSGGEKMSKSRGNVIDPFEVVEKYGADALRYWLLREVPTFEDGDFTWERFKESYNAHLANGLGNLVARIMKLAEDYLSPDANDSWEPKFQSWEKEYRNFFERFELKQVFDLIFSRVRELDRRIVFDKPFEIVKKNPDGGKQLILDLTRELAGIAAMLEPFLPATSEVIKTAIEENKKPATLFPRIV